MKKLETITSVKEKLNKGIKLNASETVVLLEHIDKLEALKNSRTCQCKECTDVYLHRSDCAVHNAPAEPKGNCNCKSFEDAVNPVMKWLAQNHHPHTTIIVEGNRAELVEGVECVNTDEFIPD